MNFVNRRCHGQRAQIAIAADDTATTRFYLLYNFFTLIGMSTFYVTLLCDNKERKQWCRNGGIE